MKRVALLKSRFGHHGGLEKYASRIAQAFVEKGDKVTILSTGIAPCLPIDIQCTQTIGWPAFLRMEQFDAFVTNWLQHNDCDLIFGMDRNRHQTHIRAGNGVHAAYLQNRKIIEGKLKYFLCKINPLHQKILTLEKAAFENPSLKKLFTNSHMVKEQILATYNTNPNKIQVVHNGVEWHEMEDDFNRWPIAKENLLKQLNLNRDFFQLLFIGNGYLRKGLGPLLEAMSCLKNKKIELSIIGKENAEDVYKAQAAKLGLQNRVHFFGARKEIRPFYQLADSLIIPSFYDPFANVTVEALAMGLFVVSSKQNGGHEILSSSNGHVIEDLFSQSSLIASLEMAIERKKSPSSALSIRNSVKHLDFSNQLKILMDSCG